MKPTTQQGAPSGAPCRPSAQTNAANAAGSSAEEAWRTLKSGLRVRPVYHRVARRIRAHIAISVWALLLERVAETRCGDTWRNIGDDLRQIKLSQLTGPDGEVWQVTRPRPAASERLEKLGFKKPMMVVDPVV